MFRASSSFLRSSQRKVSRASPRLSEIQFDPQIPWRPFPFVTREAVRLNSNSNRPPKSQPIDREDETKVAQKKLESSPKVSSSSTVRKVWEPSNSRSVDHPEVSEGLKHDLGIVKDTFRLDTVPRESQILGLSGTLPYFATSLSTVFLSWNLTKDIPSGSAFFDAILVNHETARYLLDLIEPIQVGYGAVIISFLGAIHWGLEYAEKKPQLDRTRFRYGIGLAASVMAWPTLLMPIEYALTAQFGAFVALYYADSRASTRGWVPHWYAKYRFLLTAVVGFTIFVSLIGREKLSQHGALTKQTMHDKLADPGIADHDTNWAKLEKEEKKRIKEEKEEKAKEEAKAKNKENKKPNGKDKKEGGEKGSEKVDEKSDEAKAKDGEDGDKKEDQSNDEKVEKKDKDDADDNKKSDINEKKSGEEKDQAQSDSQDQGKVKGGNKGKDDQQSKADKDEKSKKEEK